MIESAQEYKEWFDAPVSGERALRLQEEASSEVWLEVIDRFPICRREVVRNRHIPLEILEVLRHDDDEGVQWRVCHRREWQEAHPDDPHPRDDDPLKLINFRLTDIERSVLRAGLSEWHGPARCTEELAVAMGFRGVEDLFVDTVRMGRAIVDGTPLSRTDWARTLLATEIVFMSDVVGSGTDWSVTTGLHDLDTLRTIRGLQVHLATSNIVGSAFGTRPPGRPA